MLRRLVLPVARSLRWIVVHLKALRRCGPDEPGYASRVLWEKGIYDGKRWIAAGCPEDEPEPEGDSYEEREDYLCGWSAAGTYQAAALKWALAENLRENANVMASLPRASADTPTKH